MPANLNSNPKIHLGRIAAPMVNQSDLPFRLLVRKYGATMAYTQMYVPHKLLNDQEYLEYHIRDLTAAGQNEFNGPVVVQLCGNDPELVVRAGRKIQSCCDAIGEVFFLKISYKVLMEEQTSTLAVPKRLLVMAISAHIS
jgi:tRNA-dihydrouridine synthase